MSKATNNRSADLPELRAAELFYQCSSQGLRAPSYTEGFAPFCERLEGDMRPVLKERLSSRRTELFLLECFGASGYAISIIRYGQERGDFALLRIGLPIHYRCEGASLRQFLTKSLETLLRYSPSAASAISQVLEEQANSFYTEVKHDHVDPAKTQSLLSSLATPYRREEDRYAWCPLEAKSVEEVIDSYFPQPRLSHYRGLFLVRREELTDDRLSVISERELKRVICLPAPTPQPDPDLMRQYGISKEDFRLARFSLDKVEVEIPDHKISTVECWEGARAEAVWDSYNRFSPIRKKAEIRTEEDMALLAELSYDDIVRRFSIDEFSITAVGDERKQERMGDYRLSGVTDKWGRKKQRYRLPLEVSLADFREGGEELNFLFKVTSKELCPCDVTFSVDRETFLRDKDLAPHSAPLRHRFEITLTLTGSYPLGQAEPSPEEIGEFIRIGGAVGNRFLPDQVEEKQHPWLRLIGR